MNQVPHLPGELARPATDPTAIVTALVPNPVGGMPASHAALLATAPAATTNSMSPMSLVRAFRRRQWLALGVASVLAAACGAAAWYFVPSKFKAQSRLQVHTQVPKVLFRTVETEDGGGDYKRYQTTQQALVKSQMVLKTALALDDYKISKYRMLRDRIDRIAWLDDELKVEFLPGSEIMEISLSGEYADEVAGVVNAVTKAYMDEVVDVDARHRTDRLKTLKTIGERYRGMLDERTKERKNLAEKLGSDDRTTLSLKDQFAEEYLDRVRSQHFDALSSKRKAEAVFNAIGAREAQPPEATSISEAEIDRMIEEDPEISELSARLAEYEDRLNSEAANVRAVARKGIKDYSLHRLLDEVKHLRQRLAESRTRIRPQVIQELQDRLEGKSPSGQSDQYRKAEQELEVWTALEQKLREEVEALTAGRAQLTTKTLALQDIQDDVASMQEAAKKIATEIESLNVELQAPPRIRVIENATVPLTKDEKKRVAIIAMTIFGSFFGGLFGVALLELQARKVDCADEVPTELGLQVVGGLPILPSRPARAGSLGVRSKDPYGYDLFVESVDATRTMLLHAARSGSHQVVMVTSAVSGEGKSSLASYLAPSLARCGQRTLLVDADLRNPSLHRFFNLPLAPGVSELLRGETSPAAVTNETAIENLSIVTAGSWDRQTIHRLAQGCLRSHFVHFKEQFDFVIVDSSPVLLVADGLIVAQQVDTVLFSIFRDVSRKTRVAAALQRLQCLRVPILGAVVTGAEGSRYGNHYGYPSTYPSLPDSSTSLPDQSAV